MKLVRNATVALVALLAAAGTACSGGDEGPSEFDPAGAAADAAALQTVWDSELADAFLLLGYDINLAIGAEPAAQAVRAVAPAVRGLGSAAERRRASEAQAATVMSLLADRSVVGGAAVLLPAEHLGTTWVWNTETFAYVRSEDAAPDDRIRFILYAPGSGPYGLAEPLTPVGHVDLVERSSGATDAVQVLVVGGDETYLDYQVSATATGSGGQVNVLGYATDGLERLDFDMRHTIAAGETTFTLESDITLELAQRQVEFRYETVTTLGETSFSQSLDLAMRGPHGDIGVSGSTTDDASGYSVAFTVEVNGERYATITWDDNDGYILAGADGRSLTPDEELALEHAFDVWNYGLGLMDAVTLPIGAFFAL